MAKIKKCKVCGEDVAKNANRCPHCGAKLKSPVAGIVLIVVGIILLITALRGGGTKGNPQKVGDATPTPTQIETQKDVFSVGESVELNDIVVTMNSVTESSGSQYNKPSDGNVFVLCEFTIENNSNKEIAISSLISFSAYADDFSTNMSLSALLEKGNKQQLDGSIDAGKKMNGVIGYEVPADYKEIEVQFTPDFWNGTAIKFVHEK